MSGHWPFDNAQVAGQRRHLPFHEEATMSKYLQPRDNSRIGPAPLVKLAYSIEEVIEATGIGRSSLYVDIAAGRLRARKRGSRTIILTADLTEYLATLPPAQA